MHLRVARTAGVDVERARSLVGERRKPVVAPSGEILSAEAIREHRDLGLVVEQAPAIRIAVADPGVQREVELAGRELAARRGHRGHDGVVHGDGHADLAERIGDLARGLIALHAP